MHCHVIVMHLKILTKTAVKYANEYIERQCVKMRAFRLTKWQQHKSCCDGDCLHCTISQLTSNLAVRWLTYLIAVKMCSLACENKGAILHLKDVQLL